MPTPSEPTRCGSPFWIPPWPTILLPFPQSTIQTIIDRDFPETSAGTDRFAAIRHSDKTTNASLLEYAYEHKAIHRQEYDGSFTFTPVERTTTEDANTPIKSKNVKMSTQEGSHADFMTELARIFGEDPAPWVGADITLVTKDPNWPPKCKWDDLASYFWTNKKDVIKFQVAVPKPK